MNGILIDTNVISELTKDAPDERVLAFLVEHDDLWLSTIVLHELEFGIARLPFGKRRTRISAVLSAFVKRYSQRILPAGHSEAIRAAELRVQMENSRRHLNLGDALIAGTAKANALVIATRNVCDFENLSLTVTNPWDW